jgi:hypothetical protein
MHRLKKLRPTSPREAAAAIAENTIDVMGSGMMF